MVEFPIRFEKMWTNCIYESIFIQYIVTFYQTAWFETSKEELINTLQIAPFHLKWKVPQSFIITCPKGPYRSHCSLPLSGWFNQFLGLVLLVLLKTIRLPLALEKGHFVALMLNTLF